MDESRHHTDTKEYMFVEIIYRKTENKWWKSELVVDSGKQEVDWKGAWGNLLGHRKCSHDVCDRYMDVYPFVYTYQTANLRSMHCTRCNLYFNKKLKYKK